MTQRKDGAPSGQYLDGWILVMGNGGYLEGINFRGEHSTLISRHSFKARLIRWIARSRLFGQVSYSSGDGISYTSDGRTIKRILPREERIEESK